MIDVGEGYELVTDGRYEAGQEVWCGDKWRRILTECRACGDDRFAIKYYGEWIPLAWLTDCGCPVRRPAKTQAEKEHEELVSLRAEVEELRKFKAGMWEELAVFPGGYIRPMPELEGKTILWTVKE
jgi:hypothetical protein